jgi:hypothetical protein
MTDTMAAKTVLICHLAKVWNLLVARACTKPNNWDTERGSLKLEHVDSEPANPVPYSTTHPQVSNSPLSMSSQILIQIKK